MLRNFAPARRANPINRQGSTLEQRGEAMHDMKHRNWYRVSIRLIQATVLSAILATGVTSGGAIYDHPIDASITAGMAAPECAVVRAMPAGSVLLAVQPDHDICRSYFLYRTASPNSTNDANSYMASVMQDRIDEFWQLFGYVWLLCLATVGIFVALAYAVRVGYWLYGRSSSAGAGDVQDDRGAP